MGRRLFTSESVTEGHPDKICDCISDAVLDEILKQDLDSRVACETAVTTGMILVMGEVTTKGYVDVASVARNVARDIGYNDSDIGFSADSCAVLTSIHGQSPDIALGVDKALEAKQGENEVLQIGAGDQGLMFGFACSETPSLMPMPIEFSHALTRRLAEVRKNGLLPYLRPDGKAQVTIEYDGLKPLRVDTVVLSTQHDENISQKKIYTDVFEEVIKKALPEEMLVDTRYFVNPTGRFVIGGPHGDSGLTGRKIIVDTYGGYSRHGGGAFSGKDPSKVDRSAAYFARYVAKHIVAADLAERCEIEVAYAIGVAKPVSVSVDTFGTGVCPDERIREAVLSVFDFRPQAIISDLGLKKTRYLQVAAYGHFGRNDLSLPWEKLDRQELLKSRI